MSFPSRIIDPATGVAAQITEEGQLRVDTLGRGSVPMYLSMHLRDANGSDDAAVNGSVTPVEFFVRPPSTEVWRFNRMLVTIEASTIIAAAYGPVAVGALANGVRIYVADDDREINDLADGGAINTSAEWGEYCFDAELKNWGAGNDFLFVRWTFIKAGVPIRLDGSKRERLAILVQDDLTGLASHEFVVQGYKEGVHHD